MTFWELSLERDDGSLNGWATNKESLSKKIGLQEGKMSLGYARSEENPLVLFLVKKHEVVIKITPENNSEHRNE